MLGNNMIQICSRTTINISLCLYYCGSAEYKPNQLWGPKVIDHFILYYIFDGQGTLEVNNVKYSVHKGQGFLISPNIISSFQADKEFPFKVAWVGFYGYLVEVYLRRANLTPVNPIFTYDKDDFLENCFEKMIELSKVGPGQNRYCKIMSILYTIVSHLIDIARIDDNSCKGVNLNEYYIRKALEFIDMNYSQKISITDIAKYLGLDRKYLHYLFKNHVNKSPQEYLIEYRMDRACELMNNNILSISDISRSVGYTDSFHFSKMFKKIKGMPPTEYRHSLIKSKDATQMYKTQIDILQQIITEKDEEIRKYKKMIKLETSIRD